MPYNSTASKELAAQARGLGQSAASKDERRKADRPAPERFRRSAMTYVLALSTAVLVASAFVFDLGSMTTGQTQSHRGVVTAAGITDSSQAQRTSMTVDMFGVTFSVPVRD